MRRAANVTAGVVGTFVVALLMVLGSSRWLPPGAGAVNHLVLPVLIFPLVWTVLILALFVARRRGRVWAVLGGLGASHALGIWWSIS